MHWLKLRSKRLKIAIITTKLLVQASPFWIIIIFFFSCGARVQISTTQWQCDPTTAWSTSNWKSANNSCCLCWLLSVKCAKEINIAYLLTNVLPLLPFGSVPKESSTYHLNQASFIFFYIVSCFHSKNWCTCYLQSVPWKKTH